MFRQIISVTALLMCVVMGVPMHGADYTYWFDNATAVAGEGALPSGGAHLDVDASQLNGAMHTLHFQVNNAEGERSAVYTAPFMMPFSLTGATAYIYVDGAFHSTRTADVASADAFAFDLDASQLDYGLHSMMVQVVSRNGLVASPVESVFMRVPTGTELGTFRCYYTIDNDPQLRREGTFSNGVVHADIDVSHLTDGLHSIQFTLAGETGLTTQHQSAYFMKLPLGGGDISGYDYWVNDDTANIRHVALDNAISPFRLTALLPLPSYPLRSSSFHFAVENGKPVIYPRNDFNIMIASSNGSIVVSSSNYFDVTQPCAVQPRCMTVEDGVNSEVLYHAEFGNIDSDEIKFFEFTALKGDLLSVKMDRTCAIEVYDGAGNEILTGNGYDVIDGLEGHTEYDGIHYVAIHDARLNKKNGFKLTIDRISKFALRSYTPKKTAPTETVRIHLNGNGYDQLKNVELISDELSFSPTYLHINDRTDATCDFNLSSCNLPDGQKLDLKLTFDDGSGYEEVLSVASAIEMEECIPGEIMVSIEPGRKAGTPYNVSLKIKNTGNVPYWGIPINIGCCRPQRYWDSKYCRLEFMDFYSEMTNTDAPMVYYTSDLFGSGHDGGFAPMVIPFLDANETLTLTVGIVSEAHACIPIKVCIGEPWSEEFKRLVSPDFKAEDYVIPESNVITATHLCYWHALALANKKTTDAPIKRATMQDLSHISDFAEHNANVAQAIGYTGGGIINGLRKNDLHRRVSAYGIDLSDPTFSSLVDYDRDLSNGMYHPAHIVATAFGREDEYLMAEQYLQGCHGCNTPQPLERDVDSHQSGDPNDILGYEAPSGSEYIGREVRMLTYTVEFENDPELATASAVKVVVDNRLDGKVFDLGSFAAREFRIGKKKVELDGAKRCVKTIDMRPEIDGIAQVEVDFDDASGELKLTVTSLDPMTMEPTEDFMQGVLPVNNGGNGTGEIIYDINLREGLPDGTAVDNMASIVFDANPAIETPVWHNVTDYVPPTSKVGEVETADNITFSIAVEGSDARSGIWCYDLYARWAGQFAWTHVAEALEPVDGKLTYVSATELTGAEFLAVAYDRAGNREDSELFHKILGDVDGNGKVDANDVLLLRARYISRPVTLDTSVADINADGAIDAQDAVAARRIYLSSQLDKHSRKRLITRKKK